MTEKRCECDALNLLRRMNSTYLAFMETEGKADYRYPRIVKGFSSICNEMVAHLESQLKRPENQGEAGKEARGRLRMAREYIAKNEPITATDIIRDGIHQHPEVRQLFLCGDPYSSQNESPLTQKVYTAMHSMSTEGGFEEAGEVLDRLYSEHTCESGEEAEEE